jgi:RHS repeat-associated protein
VDRFRGRRITDQAADAVITSVEDIIHLLDELSEADLPEDKPQRVNVGTRTVSMKSAKPSLSGGQALLSLIPYKQLESPLFDLNQVPVLVEDTGGTPVAGISVFAFDGTNYTGVNGITDANGEAYLDLPAGSYRFQADLDGTKFWSGANNHCDLPGCPGAEITVTIPVVISVADTDGTYVEGVKVYAFDGETYTGYSDTTGPAGEVSLTLPATEYRFRVFLDGVVFWSGEIDHCDLQDCTAAQIQVTKPVVVSVSDSGGTPLGDVQVTAHSGGAYTGYSGRTDLAGQLSLRLPAGDYRFRADYEGAQFWSSAGDDCQVPGCETASVTVNTPVTVTVLDSGGTPQEGLLVYAYDGDTNVGFSGTTDAVGQVEVTLPEGGYRFRVDYNGTAFWSDAQNDCTLPGCTEAGVTVMVPVLVTVVSESGDPYPNLPVYAFDGEAYTGFSGMTDANGQTTLTLPAGSYRFRTDYQEYLVWSGEVNTCDLPGCTDIQVTIPDGLGTYQTVIDYAYDPLNRLTAADYDDGTYFHYTYDAVGNRLTQDTLAGTNAYTYDAANRLTAVDGVPYTWDNNGSLLSDGVSTYTYNYANMLASVTQEGVVHTYAYNGLGDRLEQTVDSQTTRYTLDLNTGLTQVLADGTHTYLYGQGRIAQVETNPEYFLGDALSSVRQLVGSEAGVSLLMGYDPFGGALMAEGSGTTKFQYTGEIRDATGLIYLRARNFNPAHGRFLSVDPFAGLYDVPASLHPYAYAHNNPILYTDPSGQVIGLGTLLLLGLAGGALGGIGYYSLQHLTDNDPCGQWEWGEALFWSGGGSVLGIGVASIGYLGYLAGSYLGWWEVTRTTGVALCADGDCTNEAISVVEKTLCADGDCTNEARSVAEKTQNIWQSMNPFARGRFLERVILNKWYGGGNPDMASNYPTIDNIKNQVITSIKSINLNDVTYQNIANLRYTVNSYINSLSKFVGVNWGGLITSGPFRLRELIIVVPPGASAEQWALLMELQALAAELGVVLNLIVYP